MTTQTKLITYDDYQTLPDDGQRYEIIEGELLMSPAPKTIHQRISRNLLIYLSNYINQHDIGEIFYAPCDVVLSMTDVVQPDLLFVGKERSHIITENNIIEAPDLVIEILSESTETIDHTRKKSLYEKHGVKEYWIINPSEKAIEQFVLRDKSFEIVGSWGRSQKLVSPVMEGLSLPIDNIF
jgi:Uma2 family endonuclease